MDRRTFFKGALTLPVLLTPTKNMGEVLEDSPSGHSEENYEIDENYELEIADSSFRGKFSGTVEINGRVRLPARIFATLQRSGSRDLVMFSKDGVISCFSEKEWAEVEKDLLSRENKDKIKRLICNRSRHCKVDKMGYVKIPKSFLAEHKIKDKVVFTGLLDCFEIMESELFKKLNSDIAKDIAEGDLNTRIELAQLGLL